MFPNFWDLPWWKAEEWETLEETTTREVKEETNLDFKAKKLFNEESKQEVELWIFRAFLGNAVWKIVLNEEASWYGWFTYEETKSLQIIERTKGIIEKLLSENLL